MSQKDFSKLDFGNNDGKLLKEEVVGKEIIKKKVGRPKKNTSVKYIRLTVDIPEPTAQKIKFALATKYFGNKEIKTQADLVNSAILEFLKKI